MELSNRICQNQNQKLDDSLQKQLNGICRFCLKQEQQKNNLISLEPQSSNLTDLISSNIWLPPSSIPTVFVLYKLLTSTELNCRDAPQQICIDCLMALLRSVEFKIQLEMADTILKGYITQGFRNGLILEHLDTQNLNKYYKEDTKLMKKIQAIIKSFKSNNDNNFDENSSCLSDIESSLSVSDKFNNDSNLDAIKYKCSQCNEEFTFIDDLNCHMSIHSKPLICVKCNKQFVVLKKIRRHVRIHFKDKPYKCTELNCNKKFPESIALTRHIERTHSNKKKIRKYVCNFSGCFKKYFDKYSLKIHERIHKNYKPYECDFQNCRKNFNDIRLLHSHIKTHESEQNYACTFCDKKFNHRSTLTNHSRVHTQEKPYECIVCQKKFNQSSNLRYHMQSHGEESLLCQHCDKKFPASKLRTHQKRDHFSSLVQNICKFCSKSYSNNNNLKKHMIKIHNIDDFKIDSSVFEGKNQIVPDDQLLQESMTLVDALLSHAAQQNLHVNDEQ